MGLLKLAPTAPALMRTVAGVDAVREGSAQLAHIDSAPVKTSGSSRLHTTSGAMFVTGAVNYTRSGLPPEPDVEHPPVTRVAAGAPRCLPGWLPFPHRSDA